MHRYTELIDRAAAFVLHVLQEATDRTVQALQTSAATSLVKTLQMIELSKATMAINALKHGRGASYDALVTKADSLPFRIKRPGQHFYDEGDVSEVSTLVQVDDKFVLGCADVIRDVSEALYEEYGPI